MERWLSGRKRHGANVLGVKAPRGFESHSLRFGHIKVFFFPNMKLILIDGGPASGKNTLGNLLIKEFYKAGNKKVILLDLDIYVEQFNPTWVWKNEQQKEKDQLQARINFAKEIDKYLGKKYIVVAIGEKILTKKDLDTFVSRLKTTFSVALYHLTSPLSLCKQRLHERGPYSFIDLDKDQRERDGVKVWPGYVYKNISSPEKDAANLFQLIQNNKGAVCIDSFIE